MRYAKLDRLLRPSGPPPGCQIRFARWIETAPPMMQEYHLLLRKSARGHKVILGGSTRGCRDKREGPRKDMRANRSRTPCFRQSPSLQPFVERIKIDVGASQSQAEGDRETFLAIRNRANVYVEFVCSFGFSFILVLLYYLRRQ
ncbi:hypothetical protein BD310DRAFT_633060 [Dichomitus squalens]|uniref:Uncharacterized protein n=1 Tax=Dichomitus squalens TaxID=114155 RepID=A0A4Q9PPN2_9APHY|nr:hypothetical protein BD310DRAFT_633060 [Dichomitus squalens]